MTASTPITTAKDLELTPGKASDGDLECRHTADVAQLVERQLPKLEVAGSSPVIRLAIDRWGYSLPMGLITGITSRSRGAAAGSPSASG